MEPGDQNDHLIQNIHGLDWTSNIKHWTLNIDLQALHWNLLEPHLWRVGKSTWLGRPMLDEASEDNDYLENQHLARPTWEPGRELEELRGGERDASWKLMLLLSLILRLVLQNLQSVSYLIFFFWRLLFHNWIRSNILESGHLFSMGKENVPHLELFLMEFIIIRIMTTVSTTRSVCAISSLLLCYILVCWCCFVKTVQNSR